MQASGPMRCPTNMHRCCELALVDHKYSIIWRLKAVIVGSTALVKEKEQETEPVGAAVSLHRQLLPQSDGRGDCQFQH